MRKLITYIGAGIITAALLVVAATTANAWHPVGSIKKEVQNITQNSQLQDANSESQAVTVNPGDTLRYVVTVYNKGQHHNKGWNDMHFTKVTDNLPAGVTLVSGQTNMDLGHIATGKSKSYEFTVKVTSNKDGDVICNTANFTGDSEVRDQPQKGSDKACVKVVVPQPKMIEICYKNQGPTMHTIKETEFNPDTMSTNPADCKKPVKMIEVCYRNQGPTMHTIKETEFNKDTMSTNPADCKKPVKMIEICYKNKGTEMHKIKETEFNPDTMSTNPADCKKPVEKIQVCYIGKGEKMHTIKATDFNPKTMSKNSADCKKPVKMIEVCYKNQGPTMHTIKETDFNKDTMSKNSADCKKPVEKIEVCLIGKGEKMHKIKASEFNEKTMSKNPADCKKPETPKPVDKNIEICDTKTKEIRTIKESEFDKETMTHDKKVCATQEPEPVPTPTPEPSEPVVELPKTGMADFLGVLGIGSLATTSIAYIRSRR